MDIGTTSAFIFIIFAVNWRECSAALKRCYECRSRGPLGDCKDPFNPQGSLDGGIQAIPCASGWCAKIFDGQNFKDDDYGTAIERICLISAPTDNTERCTEAIRKDRKVKLCSCQGDLCNPATSSLPSLLTIGFLLFSVFLTV